MTTTPRSLFARDDTFLGVCEGIGQDFGFNPLWLRVALAVLFLVSPAVVLGGYLALGLSVAFARWLFPTRPQTEPETAAPDAPLQAENDDHAIAIAA